MDWRALGRTAALHKLALAGSHPLLRGVKVDVSVPKPEDADPSDTPAAPRTWPAPPKAKVWPPPPLATSGTLLNPKVA